MTEKFASSRLERDCASCRITLSKQIGLRREYHELVRAMKGVILADLVLRESFRKHSIQVPASIRTPLAEARRFVLDDAASRFLGDLAHAAFTGEINEKTFDLFDQIRKLARLPHKQIWIEFNQREEFKYTLEKYGERFYQNAPEEEIVKKTAWLVSTISDSMFCARPFVQLNDDSPQMVPFNYLWTVDDTILTPGKTMEIPFTKADVKIEHLRAKWGKFCWESATGLKIEPLSHEGTDFFIPPTGFLNVGIGKNEVTEFCGTNSLIKLMRELRGDLRKLLALLAAINDVPIGVKHVVASKGFVAQGRYRKFFSHSIISINLPKGRDPQKFARQIIAAAKRRAHQVRGHWRRDWRHEDNRIWIKEHLRGDISLGFVMHDYKVEHETI